MARLFRALHTGVAAALGLAGLWLVARVVAERLSARPREPRAPTPLPIPLLIVGSGQSAELDDRDAVEAVARSRGLRVRGRHYGLVLVLVTVAAVLLLLGLGGYVGLRVLFGGGSSDKGGTEDFPAFDESGPAATAPVVTGAVLPAVTAPGDVAPEAAGGDGAGPTPGAGDAAGTGAGSVLRPPAGRYTYAAAGTAETRIFGFSAIQRVPASVGGSVAGVSDTCWSHTLELVVSGASKIDTSVYCAQGAGSLVSPGGRSSQKQFGLSLTSDVTCTPAQTWVAPGMQPGQRFPAHCVSRNSGVLGSDVTLGGYHEFVGVETVDVGGRGVPAWHLHQEQPASGSNVTGLIRTDNYFATADGMLVKIVRSTRFSGFASYREETTFVLKSTTPG